MSACFCLCFKAGLLVSSTLVPVWVAFISPVSTSITSISSFLPPSRQTNYTDTENPMWGWNQCCHHLQTITADAQRWIFHGRGSESSSREEYWRACYGDTWFLLLFLLHAQCASAVAWTAVDPSNLIFIHVAEFLNIIQGFDASHKSDWYIQLCEFHHSSGGTWQWVGFAN